MASLTLKTLTALLAAVAVVAAAPLEGSSTTSTSSSTEALLALRGMAARPRIGSVPYGVQLKSCVSGNKIALTFDDGPSEFTPRVLDMLEQAGDLKATFFVVGKNGQFGVSYAQYAATLKRAVAAGHQIGSHSYSHADFDTLSDDGRESELTRNEDAIAAVLGFVPTYFRPPYTHCGGACLATLADMSYHVTDYDLDTLDWQGDIAASKSIFANAIANAPTSFVSLAHDIHEATVNELVPFMIQQAKAKGYQFVTIGECLGDPEENWYRDPSTGKPANIKQPAASPPTPTSQQPAPPTTTSTSSKSSSSSSSSSSTKSSSSSTATSKPSGANRAPSGRSSTTSAAPIVTSASQPTTTSSQGAAAGGVGGSIAGSLLAGVAGWLLML